MRKVYAFGTGRVFLRLLGFVPFGRVEFAEGLGDWGAGQKTRGKKLEQKEPPPSVYRVRGGGEGSLYR